MRDSGKPRRDMRFDCSREEGFAKMIRDAGFAKKNSKCGILVKKERVCGIMTPFPDPMLTVAVFLLASSPGDPVCAGVPDVLLEKAIINAGATEIDLKVAQNFFMDHVPF